MHTETYNVKFSKVSVQLNLLYKLTIVLTLENRDCCQRNIKRETAVYARLVETFKSQFSVQLTNLYNLTTMKMALDLESRYTSLF